MSETYDTRWYDVDVICCSRCHFIQFEGEDSHASWCSAAVPSCGHQMCLMEAALHGCGKCTEYDQIVPGVYCPLAVCHAGAPPLFGELS